MERGRALLQRGQARWRRRCTLPSRGVEGIYSHFANADAWRTRFHRALQLERFPDVLEFYPAPCSLPMPMRQCCSGNSAGVLQLPESHLDLVRPGIMLYGVYPSTERQRTITVEPALQWQSQVVLLKVVQPGAGSPELRLDVAERSRRAHGHGARGLWRRLLRALSNRAQVLIRGHRYPIVAACMDQFMVNIEWDTAYNGDTVTLLGHDGMKLSPWKIWPTGPARSRMKC